jgi:cell division protein YceG involved in septum cleavage
MKFIASMLLALLYTEVATKSKLSLFLNKLDKQITVSGGWLHKQCMQNLGNQDLQKKKIFLQLYLYKFHLI